MNDNLTSIVIEDLVLTADNIREMNNKEVEEISGGARISFTFPDYTYTNDDGEVVETGTRPDGLELATEESPDSTSLSLSFSASS